MYRTGLPFVDYLLGTNAGAVRSPAYVAENQLFDLTCLLDPDRLPRQDAEQHALRRAARSFDLRDEGAWQAFVTAWTTLDAPQALAMRSALLQEVCPKKGGGGGTRK